jgi:hypothetical protein
LVSSFAVALFVVVPEGLKLVHLALAVMVAVTADFVFNRRDLEILPYYRIRHVPWCVRYHAQSLRLEAFEYFYVGRGTNVLKWKCYLRRVTIPSVESLSLLLNNRST